MTDNELKQLVAGLAVANAELRASQAKTDAQIAKTDEKLDRIAKMVGGMAANQGDVAEEYFFNALAENPVIGNITFDSLNAKMLRRMGKKQKEFDIVLVNGSSVAVIEVKYKAHMADLEQAQEQVQHYRDLFPEHKGYTIYTGLAGMSVPQEVVDAAHKKGVFVLKQVGDVMVVDAEQMRGF